MKQQLVFPDKIVRVSEQIDGFKVSVLVPCKNPDIDYLKICLQSIKDQWYEPFEVLVLDNNSSLNISKDVKKLCKHSGFEYRREEKDGIGYARKRLVEMSKGDYVAFLSCDDEWNPNFLLRMVEEAVKNVGCVIYCSYDVMTSEGFVNKTANTLVFSDFLDFCVASLEQAHDNTMFVCFDCVLIPKKVFSVYNFDEELRQSEDLDFLLNTMLFVPYVGIKDKLAYYRVHENSTTTKTSHSIASINKTILDRFYLNINKMKEGDLV